MEVTVESVPTNPRDRAASGAAQTDTVSHLMAARHFNIDTPTKEEDGKLKEIWEHGKSLSQSGDLNDILWQVMHLSRTLGAPRLGESPLDKVYRWAKLKRQEIDIQSQLREL